LSANFIVSSANADQLSTLVMPGGVLASITAGIL